MVVALLIVLELYTQAPARHGMLWIASDPLQNAIFNLKQHCAGVGTIMRAAPKEDLALGFLVHVLPPVATITLPSGGQTVLLQLSSLEKSLIPILADYRATERSKFAVAHDFSIRDWAYFKRPAWFG
jgi:hypothetical protein